MKQITCADLGGPADCGEVIKGNTAEEMIQTGWTHLQEKHPDLAEKIGKNTQEENDKWMNDFKEKFASLPEAEAPAAEAPEAEAAA